jgi:hypothetical protein
MCIQIFLYISFIIVSFFVLGCIVTFTKVLTIYHNWIQHLHHSLLSPTTLPPFLE